MWFDLTHNYFTDGRPGEYCGPANKCSTQSDDNISLIQSPYTAMGQNFGSNSLCPSFLHLHMASLSKGGSLQGTHEPLHHYWYCLYSSCRQYMEHGLGGICKCLWVPTRPMNDWVHIYQSHQNKCWYIKYWPHQPSEMGIIQISLPHMKEQKTHQSK